MGRGYTHTLRWPCACTQTVALVLPCVPSLRGAYVVVGHRGIHPQPIVFVVCNSFLYPHPRSTWFVAVLDVEVNQVVDDLYVAHIDASVLG